MAQSACGQELSCSAEDSQTWALLLQLRSRQQSRMSIGRALQAQVPCRQQVQMSTRVFCGQSCPGGSSVSLGGPCCTHKLYTMTPTQSMMGM